LVNQRVGCAEVNRQVVREETEKGIKDHNAP